ncbi:MAG: F0F1 ATP synthase subunit epsilon [Chloroflexi bacterium]|nr:F0F1 ATP synthase subunit epsilon [Chloroflexota bacterium]
MVFSDDVNEAVAWGVEGQLGILPHHTPLMTMLQAGELLIRRGEEEQYLAISGGFLEVRSDKVVILADGCERAEEIDTARAEAARRRAQETLSTGPAGVHDAAAEAALRRSLARLKVAGRKRHRPKGWL